MAPKGLKTTYGEGMVQRTNADYGGRESVSVMKGEVVSSILTGSTTSYLYFQRSALPSFSDMIGWT